MSEELEQQSEPSNQPESSVKKSRSDAFVFKGGINIFPLEELAHFSRGNGFACRASGKKGEDYIALLCSRDQFPRVEDVSKYNALQSLSLPKLVASGVSDLSKETQSLLSEQKYIFIYENIYGDPLSSKDNSLAMGMHSDTVRHRILPSLVTVLYDLSQTDLCYGGLHVDSIFTSKGISDFEKSEGGKGNVCLREFLSLPFSYSTPALYLPANRASVPPLGRGRGVFSDEIYSLGVLLSVLLRKYDPCEGLDEKEILHRKISQSSYQAIVGENRVDVYFLNALRGMLQDDPNQRWTLQDVMMWVDGQRIGPKQGGVKRLMANRPLEFDGKTYLRPEILALDFEGATNEATQLVSEGELEKWIDRSVANPALKAHLQIAFEEAEKYGQRAGAAERKIAQIALMLNNWSPLFYKDQKFLPDGFGKKLCTAAASGEGLKDFIEIIDMNLLEFWLEHQVLSGADKAVLLSMLESCRMSLKQAGFGYGIERCVYLLCEDSPCLSSPFSSYYIKTPEDYFWALNDLCDKKKAPDRVIDRHVAAFLSVRDRHMIDPYITDLNAPVPYIRAMAILNVLSTIQSRSVMGKAVGVSNWIVDNLAKHLLERLHDRELRKTVSLKLKKLASTGDIVAMATLFEKEGTLKEDQSMYNKAKQHYQNLLNEEKVLAYNVKHNKRYGQGTGREVASIISAGASFVIVLIVLFSFFGEKLGGG